MKRAVIEKLIKITVGLNILNLALIIVFMIGSKIIELISGGRERGNFIPYPVPNVIYSVWVLPVLIFFFYMINKQLSTGKREKIVCDIWCMVVFTAVSPIVDHIISSICTKFLWDHAYYLYFNLYLYQIISWLTFPVRNASYAMIFITCTASIFYKLTFPAVQIPDKTAEPSSTLSLESEESEEEIDN